MTAQLPLALRFPVDTRFDTFVGSEVAVAQLQALADGRGSSSILLLGAAGSGRTHLALACCAAAEAAGRTVAFLPVAGLGTRLAGALDGLARNALVALDDVDAAAGDGDAEHALFVLHNAMTDAGHALLYTARVAPADWPAGLPDLRSRLSQCTRMLLTPADDAARRELLHRRAARRGLALDAAAVDWLLHRAGRDLAALADLFERLDRASLAAQRRLTVPFLREVLPELSGQPAARGQGAAGP